MSGDVPHVQAVLSPEESAAAFSVTDYLDTCARFPGLKPKYHPTLAGLLRVTWCPGKDSKKLLRAALLAVRPDLIPRESDDNDAEPEPADVGQEQPELR